MYDHSLKYSKLNEKDNDVFLRWLQQEGYEGHFSQYMKQKPTADPSKVCEFEIPDELICTITKTICDNPVRITHGNKMAIYEKDAICTWFEGGNYTDPSTGAVLSEFLLEPASDIFRKCWLYRKKHSKICGCASIDG